jgi:hypothetical protein
MACAGPADEDDLVVEVAASAGTVAATGIERWQIQLEADGIAATGRDRAGRVLFSQVSDASGLHVQVRDGAGAAVHELSTGGARPDAEALAVVTGLQTRFAADVGEQQQEDAADEALRARAHERSICVSPQVALVEVALTAISCGGAVASTMGAVASFAGATVAALSQNVAGLAAGTAGLIGSGLLAYLSWWGCGGMLAVDALTVGYWALCKFAAS